MRGVRISKENHEFDIVLVAARYTKTTHRLVIAQGFTRRGEIWSDKMLFKRASLLENLRDGLKVSTGQNLSLPGEFSTDARVQIVDTENGERIQIEGASSREDSLDLPQF